jgi:ribosomal protein S27AE
MTRHVDAVKQMGLDGEISLLGRCVRLQAERCPVYVTEGLGADEKGLTMERMCIACGGSGLAEHVDRTVPPPPCRLCHPDEAALHMALAHETRSIVAAHRLDAYQSLRAAIVRGDVVPPSGRGRSATPTLPSSHSMMQRAPLTAWRRVTPRGPGTRSSCVQRPVRRAAPPRSTSRTGEGTTPGGATRPQGRS